MELVHEEIHSCRNQMLEVLNSFAEKIVIFVFSGLYSCYLLFHEMVRCRKETDMVSHH